MTTGAKRQAAQDVTRALVLAAARRLFTEKGYEATNVREIAAAAGRSTGSVFGNWPDKEALWKAAMGRAAPDARRFVSAVLRGTECESLFRDASEFLTDMYGSDACTSVWT
jgi:AcrR family transcriptional regulator